MDGENILGDESENFQDIEEFKNAEENKMLKNSQFLLTYKTHINKEKLLDKLIAIKGKGYKKYLAAHENVDMKHAYKHTHVYIHFGFEFTSDNFRIFDWRDEENHVIHPHIRVCGKNIKKLIQYLAKEDAYQNLMRNYGLPASYYTPGLYGKQEGFDKLLANDVSAVELEDRISTAQKRVLNANPEVLNAIKNFYGDSITNGDILAYTLDPTSILSTSYSSHRSTESVVTDPVAATDVTLSASSAYEIVVEATAVNT